MKRASEMGAAAVGLVCFSPVLVGAALAIKLDSTGPVFYRGTRTGLGGNPFRIFKFRTMSPIQPGEPVALTTANGNPRITKIGRTLRRYKIDELPQLVNVLRGEMSLVGPRPELPEYTKRYNAEERKILSVRPGITDYSSLRFHDLGSMVDGDDTDHHFEEMILPIKNRLRLEYVQNQSLAEDLRIVFLTLATLLSTRFRG